MKDKILKELDKADDQLQQLVIKLSRFSDEDLNQKPIEGKWSVLQVMEHLKLSEHYALDYLKKKTSGDRPLKNTSLIGKISPSLYNLFFSLPVKVKAPQVVSSEHLPERSSFWEVTKSWKAQRAEMRKVIQSLPDKALKSEIYRHPMFGRSNAKALMKFVFLHTKRHIKQIDEVLSHFVY